MLKAGYISQKDCSHGTLRQEMLRFEQFISMLGQKARAEIPPLKNRVTGNSLQVECIVLKADEYGSFE